MPGRTFRVFVSSTFSDLKAERKALTRWVFPRLRALCESRGYKFQAVDLRWGVRDEAAADQQTVRICLDEIARCQRLSPRPNFIVLLGDRYGWCPLPSVIPADEMDALRPYIEADALPLVFGDPDAPDHAEPVAKHGWYWRDENAVPAEYVLQPRRGAFERYEVWEPVERRLREALARAAERAGLGEAACRKYRASATELEVMKGAVAVVDAREHVFAFFRSIPNLDDVKAALPGETAKELVDTLPDKTWDREAWNAQGRLKEMLRQQLGEANIWRYQAKWNGVASGLDLSGVLAELPAGAAPPPVDAAFPETRNLCEATWQRLSRVIAVEMDALDRENRDPLELEKRAHAEFGAERRRVFVGRQGPLLKIAAYLSGGPARPLVIHGPSGSGKSALMARAIADARAAHPGAVVIERFIGASPGASEIRPLLESICQEINRAFGGDQAAIGDYPKLVAELPKRLALATPDRPLIVFWDALDQLGETEEGRHLGWLPRELPANVRIVVSTLEEEKYQCFPALRAGTDDGDFVRVAPLTKDEGSDILNEWLKESPGRTPRTLTTGTTQFNERGQVDLVLARFEKEGSPLYLKLAFEEARRWHSYDGDLPAEALPGDVAGMIRALFARLSEPSQHGALIVSRALAHLAAARYGLSDEEMLDLLWRDPGVKVELQEHAQKHHRLPEDTGALPPVIWSRLFFDLEPYLSEREIFGVRLLSFYHRQLGEVAAADFLPGPSRARFHADLADYFAARWQRPDAHALLELLGHLVGAGREGKAKELLLQYEWLAKKLSATNIDLLLADYDELPLDRQEPAGLVGGALRLSSHALAERRGELASQLLGRMFDFKEPEVRRLLEGARVSAVPPTFVPIRRSLDPPGGCLLRTLFQSWGHSPDALALSDDGGTAASGYTPVIVWDLRSGRELRRIPEEGHIALSADGRTLACGGASGELTIWDVRSGKLLRKITDQARIAGVALSADGRFVVSVTWSFRVWDVNSGELLRSIEFYRDRSRQFVESILGRYGERAMLIASDGTVEVWDIALGETSGRTLDEPRNTFCAVPSDSVVSAGALSDDGETVALCMRLKAADRQKSPEDVARRMEVWDVRSGKLRHTVVDEAQLNRIAINADGRVAVSGSGGSPYAPWDKRPLKVWDLASGKLVATLIGSYDGIGVVKLSADGRTALSASGYGELRLWDLGTESIARTPREEQWPSWPAVAVTDGGLAVVAASGRALNLWDVPSNTLVRRMEGHQDIVHVTKVTRDCQIAVSGSRDKTVRVWDIHSGTLLHTLVGHQGDIFGLALSLDGAVAVSGSDDDGTLRVWDVASGSLVRTLRGHTGWVRNVAVSADGQIAVSASHDNTLRFWSIADGAMVSLFEGNSCWGGSMGGGLAVSATSQVVVSSSQDGGRLEIRDADSGRLNRTLSVGTVNALALSDDAQIAVTICGKDLKAWDLSTGRILALFTGDHIFESVAVTSDGHRIVAGDVLGRIHLLDLLLPESGSTMPAPAASPSTRS